MTKLNKVNTNKHIQVLPKEVILTICKQFNVPTTAYEIITMLKSTKCNDTHNQLMGKIEFTQQLLLHARDVEMHGSKTKINHIL